MTRSLPPLPVLLRRWPGVNARRLVLALDYDGTLTPIVSRPEQARPGPEVLDRLHRLASLAGVTVVVVSGRDVQTLASWLPVPGMVLIGSQGGEWRWKGRCGPLLARADFDRRLASAAERLRGRLAPWSGVQIEQKYASLAVHYRNVPAGMRRALLGRVKVEAEALRNHLPTLEVTAGKCVREFRQKGVNKGAAFREAVRRAGLVRVPVLAAGDDRTDEDLFAVLGTKDLTIHVGRRRTLARHRTRNPRTFHRILEGLIRYREAVTA